MDTGRDRRGTEGGGGREEREEWRKREMKSEGARRPNEKVGTARAFAGTQRHHGQPIEARECHGDALGVVWPSERAKTCDCVTRMA